MPQSRTSRLAALVVAASSFAAALFAAVPPSVAEDKASEIPADTEIVTRESGLQYSVLVAGKPGKSPKMGESVKVHYTGWLTNGTKFDSSRDRGQPTEFTVGGVIAGWNEALQLMTRGARWKLTIPAKLAYGDRASPQIPANSVLIFDVELIDFRSLPEFTAPDAKAQTKTESGFKYEVLAEGAGDPPTAKDAFELKFAFWNTKGSLIDCSEKAGQTLKSRVDDLSLAFMKEAVQKMKPGAKWRFEVPAALCFGERAMSMELPANSDTVWEIELIRVIHPLPIPAFAMPDETKAKTTESGLKYEVIEEGAGTPPKRGEKVKFHYAGWISDGTLLGSSFERGEEMEAILGNLQTKGWNEGVMLMKPGAVYRFAIPPAIGFGDKAVGTKIPANSTLVFYVKLVKVGE